MRPSVSILVATALLAGKPALAETKAPATPPQNAMKLSEIVARIEQRPQFHYIKEIDWDREGVYDIIYYTTDKARVEIKINPVTGEAQL